MLETTISRVAIVGLILALTSNAQALPVTIGPGSGISGATGSDTPGEDRLNVDRTGFAPLLAGTYDVLDFQLNVINNGAGTITPMLLTGPPSSYTTLWIGDAFDPSANGVQSAATYAAGAETFLLLAAGRVYGAFFTESSGGPIPGFAGGGSTDHDNAFIPPTAVGNSVSAFSNPGLGRSYAFEINIDANASNLSPIITRNDGNSSAVGTDLLQTNFGSVSASGFGETGGTDPIGTEPVMRDGTATGIAGYNDNSPTTVVVANGAVLTYMLDTVANPLGYQIDQIDIFHGWRDDGRDDITDFDVAYSTVGDPGTFLDLVLGGDSTDYASNFGLTNILPGGGGTFIATDVAGLRITFDGIQNGYGGISEIDVLGSAVAVVPEPSTFALAALGLLGLGFYDWRRRRK